MSNRKSGVESGKRSTGSEELRAINGDADWWDVRSMADTDWPQVQRIGESCRRSIDWELWDQWARHDSHFAYVVLEPFSNEVVGWMRTIHQLGEAKLLDEVVEVVVRPCWRRKGVGRAALSYAEHLAQEGVSARVFEEHHDEQLWLRACGYSQSGRQEPGLLIFTYRKNHLEKKLSRVSLGDFDLTADDDWTMGFDA